MEQIVTVEETQIKDKKCILLRIKGGKQFVLQCEVRPTRHIIFQSCQRDEDKELIPFYFYIFSVRRATRSSCSGRKS